MRGRVRRSGAFLPSLRAFTQNPADPGGSGRADLDSAAAGDTLMTVVAAFPQEAGTFRPIRYPSPDGRRCAVLRRPPIFSSCPGRADFRREPAHCARQAGAGFDAGAILSQVGGWFATEEWRGPELCKDGFYVGRRLSGWRCLRAAAKACPNRRFSGLAQGRAPQRCSMAASRPARLSGRLETSPIARPIPAAVAEFTRARAARDVTTMTTGAPCAGGLFIAGGYLPETGGRDETCSRRS